MRFLRLALLAVLAFAPIPGGCAPGTGAPDAGPGLRDPGSMTNPGADGIPLFSSRRVPGCRYRPAGDLAAASLPALQDEAHQMLAHAVVDVRRHVEAVPQGRGDRGGRLRPAVAEYYTGLAVRFVGTCEAADPGLPYR